MCLNNNKAQPAQRRVRGELQGPYEFSMIILVANTQDNQPTTFWLLHFQHDGTEVGTPLRQGRVHWLQARPPQPTREHRSPEGRGMWRKWRRQVVHLHLLHSLLHRISRTSFSAAACVKIFRLHFRVVSLIAAYGAFAPSARFAFKSYGWKLLQFSSLLSFMLSWQSFLLVFRFNTNASFSFQSCLSLFR